MREEEGNGWQGNINRRGLSQRECLMPARIWIRLPASQPVDIDQMPQATLHICKKTEKPLGNGTVLTSLIAKLVSTVDGGRVSRKARRCSRIQIHCRGAGAAAIYTTASNAGPCREPACRVRPRGAAGAGR
jgi:hypothetical protein